MALTLFKANVAASETYNTALEQPPATPSESASPNAPAATRPNGRSEKSSALTQD